MSSNIGMETSQYMDWLQAGVEEARSKNKFQDRAHALAATWFRSMWIMNGCPNVEQAARFSTISPNWPDDKRSQAEEAHQKILEHARTHAVTHEQFQRALETMRKMTMAQVIALSAFAGIFEQVSTDMIKVMDVMQR